MGTFGLGGVSSMVCAAPTLRQKLNQTNAKRNYFHQKKKQTDIKLKNENKKNLYSMLEHVNVIYKGIKPILKYGKKL